MKLADVHSRDLPSAHTLTWSSHWTWHAADLTLNKTHHNYCETSMTESHLFCHFCRINKNEKLYRVPVLRIDNENFVKNAKKK